MLVFRVVPSGLLALVLAGSLSAQEWVRFRGPNGSGLSRAELPTKWTEKDYCWKVSVPGVGHSSPVLWGEKIFLTSANARTGTRFVLCLNAGDGKVLWTHETEGRRYRTHRRNSFATATPTVDAERVYVTWATPAQLSALALDHAGKRLWQTHLGPYKSQHGYGVSPILVDDLLIVPNDQDSGGSLIALEAATGKVRWEIARHGKNATYSTPCVLSTDSRPAELIFTNWQLGITALDPRTGKTNWALSVFDTTTQERAVASPVVAGDLVLGTCGFATGKKHLVAVRPGPAGPEEVWRLEKGVSYLPTPLVKGERVFLCSEQGLASCLDVNSGKVLWQERLPGAFSASPVCSGQHLYCVSNDGTVFVLAAADTFKLLARNRLGEPTQCTPAIAGGRLFFRTEHHLIALDGKSVR